MKFKLNDVVHLTIYDHIITNDIPLLIVEIFDDNSVILELLKDSNSDFYKKGYTFFSSFNCIRKIMKKPKYLK